MIHISNKPLGNAGAARFRSPHSENHCLYREPNVSVLNPEELKKTSNTTTTTNNQKNKKRMYVPSQVNEIRISETSELIFPSCSVGDSKWYHNEELWTNSIFIQDSLVIYSDNMLRVLEALQK